MARSGSLNLLSMARVHDVQGFYNFESGDLVTVLEQVLDRFQPHLKEHSFRVEIDVAFLPAVMRRVHPTADSLVLGQLRFDFKRYSVTRGKRLAEFTQREMEVLQYMSECAGTVVTREELLRKIWGYQNVP